MILKEKKLWLYKLGPPPLSLSLANASAKNLFYVLPYRKAMTRKTLERKIIEKFLKSKFYKPMQVLKGSTYFIKIAFFAD